jgi:hypothetical protein
MFSNRYPHGDKGGNDQAVRNESGVTNVHSLWDDLLGTATDYTAIHFIANDINLDPRCDVSKHPEFAEHKTYAEWAKESLAYAVSLVYLDGHLNTIPMKEARESGKANEVPSVPPGYMQNARDLARLRIAEAGARLSATLHDTFTK